MIFCRAVPESIKITETYSYEQEIGQNPIFLEGPPPSGKIEVSTPYHSFQHFTHQAHADIKKQLKRLKSGKTLSVGIGHLALSHVKSIDQPVPLMVPLDPSQFEKNSFREDLQRCTSILPYTPQDPKVIPIGINFMLEDEVFEELGVPGRTMKEAVAIQMHQQLKNRRILLVELKISVHLPEKLADANLKPRIKRVSIDWPGFAPSSAFNVFCPRSGQNIRVRFNPVSKNVEWAGVESDAVVGKEKETFSGSEYTTHSSDYLLLMDQPDSLFQQHALTGEVEVEYPKCLSGAEACYFSACGFPSEHLRLEYTTKVKCKFKLILEHAFVRRVMSSMQHLFFKGRILDEDCATKIFAILDERGFEYRLEEKSGAIEAKKRIGPRMIVIRLKLEGKEQEIKHERQDGDQRIMQIANTGSLRVLMQGLLRGSGQELIHEMNLIHEELRNL